jgi:DNA-binding LacI/PurR family transcriptional regulator
VAVNDSVDHIGISCVRSDPSPAIHECILRLAALGHCRFGLLLDRPEHPTGPDYPTDTIRHAGFQCALREIGIEPDPSWVVWGLPGGMASGHEGVRQLQARGDLPSAIICRSDWVAMGAQVELLKLGYKIPEDISLVGHDNSFFCEQSEPKLTSIDSAKTEMVAKALDILLDQIENGPGKPQEILVKGEMVWRQSAGMAPSRRQGLA